MKKLAVILVAYVSAMTAIIITPVTAGANDASVCYTVADADARTYCLARARGDRATCYSIQRSDLRAMCLSDVRK